MTGVTDCITGEACYFSSREIGRDFLKILQASSSLPFVSRPVRYDGRIFMDGGLSDSIPIRKSIEAGNLKNLVILTRPRGYRQPPSKVHYLAGLRYPRYPGLRRALRDRWKIYNHTLTFIEEKEDAGEFFVIRPDEGFNIGRVERDREKLYAGYDAGYLCMNEIFPRLMEYLGM